MSGLFSDPMEDFAAMMMASREVERTLNLYSVDEFKKALDKTVLFRGYIFMNRKSNEMRGDENLKTIFVYPRSQIENMEEFVKQIGEGWEVIPIAGIELAKA